MDVLAVYGFSDATVGTVIAVAWFALLVVGVVQYRKGTRSRQRLYRTIALSFFWLAYGLFQISTALDGVLDIVIGLFGMVLMILGFVFGIRWWRGRSSAENPETSG
ncbi:hypothetical protein A4G99_01950 [Haladaptatus sp. R4]|uniref:hypothetical protein n=1 Tax=Haladaptatus sp. R4 TaxID=1679489 RepID=UPI0007B48A2E|nr:hypothetical protein [Haladaptatus sp. R4]KZN25298.1 hypothetical protein A4G99_01950 [Haladaptatus sp. R4]